MSRTTFLTLYIIIALLFSGGLASPWTITVMALTLGQKGSEALLSPVFILAVFSPIALIVLAHLRGKQIGVSNLKWFPIAAFILTLLPLLSGLLTKLLSSHGSMQSFESIGLYATIFVATTSTLGPLILHTICCVVGGKRDSVFGKSTETKSEVANTSKIIVVLVLLLFIGGYYYFARANHGEEVHWIEEAVLQDGRTINVHRTVTLTYSKSGELSDSAHKGPNYYSFSIAHPDTGKLIEWKGDYGFNPVSLDFIDGIPYLVILQFNVLANLKQYGCPEIPYIFLRYDMGNKHWDQISSSTYPAVLSHANLTAAYDGGYISEGTAFTQRDVALRNADAEGAETVGYFANTIPKDFDSWDYERKYEERNSHYQDGCRPEKIIPIPVTARRVSFTVAEKNDYEPGLVINNAADAPDSPWQKLSLDKDRSEMCKTLLKPEVSSDQSQRYFIKDASGQKKINIADHLICDVDTVWAFDYVIEKKRVVIAKYKSNGDLAFRVSFAKPDEPDGYQGSIMYPTFKFENDHIFFEWWNFNYSGHDVNVRRSMKINVRELLRG